MVLLSFIAVHVDTGTYIHVYVGSCEFVWINCTVEFYDINIHFIEYMPQTHNAKVNKSVLKYQTPQFPSLFLLIQPAVNK